MLWMDASSTMLQLRERRTSAGCWEGDALSGMLGLGNGGLKLDAESGMLDAGCWRWMLEWDASSGMLGLGNGG